MPFGIFAQKENPRRRASLGLVDPNPLMLLLAIGLLVALFIPGVLQAPRLFMRGAIGLMTLGLICIAASKVSLFRKGTWISWEPRLMTKPYTFLCKVGYVLLGTGTFLLLLVSRLTL